jgi:uncharacterized membrane protein YphA (DoxX/SURF4 family)
MDLAEQSGSLIAGLRLFFALVLATSAISKVRNLPAFEDGRRQSHRVPEPLVNSISRSVAVWELLLMLAVIIGADEAAWLVLATMVLFLGAQTSIPLRGLAAKCHCFGPDEEIGLGSIVRGALFVTFAVGYALLPRSAESAVSIIPTITIAVVATILTIWTQAIDPIARIVRVQEAT